MTVLAFYFFGVISDFREIHMAAVVGSSSIDKDNILKRLKLRSEDCFGMCMNDKTKRVGLNTFSNNVIVLIGSRLWGTATNSSDYDLVTFI